MPRVTIFYNLTDNNILLSVTQNIFYLFEVIDSGMSKSCPFSKKEKI